jgi:outer membrane protein
VTKFFISFAGYHWVLLFLLEGVALRPSQAATGPLSWEEAREKLGMQNTELKAAHEEVSAAESKYRATLGNYLPTLSAELDFTRSGAENSLNRTNYGTSLVGRWDIFSGFSSQANAQQAQHELSISKIKLLLLKARLSYELTDAVERLDYAKSLRKLSSEISKRREENLKLVELRFKNGRENKGSVLLSEAYLEQSKLEDLQSKHIEQSARSSLAKVLSLPLENHNEEISISPLPAALSQATANDPNFFQLALDNPEYQLARHNEQIAATELISARSRFYPSLGLSAQLNRSGAKFFPNEDSWSLGASLSIPLFSGGKNYYATKGAGANWQAQVLKNSNLVNLLKGQLEESYFRFIEAQLKMRADDSFQQAAQVRAEVARKKYNNGLLSFEDWDVIENDLIQRQKSFLGSKKEKTLAEANWLMTQGKGFIP